MPVWVIHNSRYRDELITEKITSHLAYVPTVMVSHRNMLPLKAMETLHDSNADTGGVSTPLRQNTTCSAAGLIISPFVAIDQLDIDLLVFKILLQGRLGFIDGFSQFVKVELTVASDLFS